MPTQNGSKLEQFRSIGASDMEIDVGYGCLHYSSAIAGVDVQEGSRTLGISAFLP